MKWLAFLLVACGTPDASPQPPRPRSPDAAAPKQGLHVEWSMHVDGSELRIDYTVENATDTLVSICDALWESRKHDPEEIVVRSDARDDVIAFTRAFLPPESGVKPFRIYMPRYRELPPSSKLTGTARTRLPLGASRNDGTAGAIFGTRTKAVLEIEYFAGATRPRGTATLLVGDVKPLPPGVRVASPEEQVERGNARLDCPSPCLEPTR